MKIVHCIIQYMPYAMGGCEVYTHTLARLQKAKGHQVAIVTPFLDHYAPGKINRQYQYEGIDVYQYLETANPAEREYYTGEKKPEGLNNFLDLIQSLNPDVIHFQELNRSTGLTAHHVLAAKQYGAKVFITMHLSFMTCNTNKLVYKNKLCPGKIKQFECTQCSYNSLFQIPIPLAAPLTALAILMNGSGAVKLLGAGRLKTLLSMPAAIKRIKTELAGMADHSVKIIALAEWYKNVLLLNGVPENKVIVIPQQLALLNMPVIKEQKSLSKLPVKLVYVGRIEFIKGIHLVIEAMKHFTPEQVMFDIYGRAENTEYYKKCIHDTAGMKNINWMGFIKREDVVETLCRYDVLCIPSLASEMAPLVIQEAFAARLPVLASKVYGNMEQIKHGKNGLLFEFNSADSLKEQLVHLVNDPGIVDALQQSISMPGDFNSIADRYISLYQEN